MAVRPATYIKLYLAVFMMALYLSHISAQRALKSTPENDTMKYVALLQGPDLGYRLNYALINACAEGDTTGIKWLLKNGADIEASTVEGVRPLHFAVGNNKADAVGLLLENGAEPDIISGYSESPLHIAVKNNNPDITELLARAGANLNITDRYGATPLHYACAYGFLSIADMLIYYEAAIYLKDKDGTNPLMAAVWASHANIADLLLQHGSDPSEKDNEGFTPFLIAAQNGDTLIMDLLINRFVNIYETNNYKYNALDLCIKSNQKTALEYLLRKGDRWNSAGVEKAVSPYLVALSYGRKELSDILTKYNIPAVSHRGFDQVNISADIKLCLHDYYTGFSMALKEPLKNFGLAGGIDFKPGYTRVLVKNSEKLFYQYMDRSYLAWIGFFKDYRLTDSPLKGNWALTWSVAGGYFFGNQLKGTSINPADKLKFLPSAGLKWYKNNLIIHGGIAWFKSPYYKIGPVWLEAGAGYALYFNKVRAPGKNIKWY